MKILKKLSTIVFASLVALVSSQTVQASQPSYEKQQVVYHVNYDDPKRQAGALRNIQNHINAVGTDNLEVRVVMHGKGLSMLLLPEEASNTKFPAGNADDKMQVKISSLKSQGVKFNVCANTVRGKNVKMAHLYDASSSDIVPSGVAEVSKLQAQGFSYLRP